jgi:8-oxo-dGTP pyrophosphatase MutT (NUDIX family)
MRTLLYDLLKRGVSLCFNTLNVLLGGNLPPFGCAAVLVEEQDRYLVVELPRGRVVFPGGFMTWREDPKHTAQREAQEETGLLVRVDHRHRCFTHHEDESLEHSHLFPIENQRTERKLKELGKECLHHRRNTRSGGYLSSG